jgi:hypothetical protein
MSEKIVGTLVCLPLAFLILGSWILLGLSIVDTVNAKEPTTLEEAIERPVKVEKFVDKENNVVCYWATRHPEYLSCLQIRGLRQHNTDVK